ncbi:MAG: hypothetical protein DRP09_19850, partial [Candidatus Thorarchaeota archaeon]
MKKFIVLGFLTFLCINGYAWADTASENSKYKDKILEMQREIDLFTDRVVLFENTVIDRNNELEFLIDRLQALEAEVIIYNEEYSDMNLTILNITDQIQGINKSHAGLKKGITDLSLSINGLQTHLQESDKEIQNNHSMLIRTKNDLSNVEGKANGQYK